MNNRLTVLLIAISVCLPCSGTALAKPVTVSSLEGLLPYLRQDRVRLTMKPGTYTVTGKATKAGEFGVQSFQEGFENDLLDHRLEQQLRLHRSHNSD